MIIKFRREHSEVLLIVPYGIETLQLPNQGYCIVLLIVPYGIETPSGRYGGGWPFALLIVPYGIETRYSLQKRIFWEPFNRTLWN